MVSIRLISDTNLKDEGEVGIRLDGDMDMQMCVYIYIYILIDKA